MPPSMGGSYFGKYTQYMIGVTEKGHNILYVKPTHCVDFSCLQ